jgi:hypothetical protein
MKKITLDRRALVGAMSAMGLSFSARAQTTAARAKMIVSKDPGCGCCNGWVDHIRAAGFEVEVRDTRELDPVKQRLGVPSELAACHTAETGGYVIEGHVPAAAIRRLLAERPTGNGLAVPGMPIGSPGMEVAGQPDEIYDVILFGPAGQRPFARFQGQQQL